MQQLPFLIEHWIKSSNFGLYSKFDSYLDSKNKKNIMIDIKKLEKQFDEILASETAESLSQWLNAYRLRVQDVKTKDEFNHKFVFYLADGFEKQGLEFEDEEVIKYLDDKFMELIKYPNFKYKQIKVKYNTVCFYAVGISQELIDDIEEQIYQILKNNNNL